MLLLGLCAATHCQEVLAPLSAAQRPQTAKSADTLVLELPFFDDFAEYEGLPDPKRWLTYQAFVNKDYAPMPPSVGMVTLDALDGNGNLYAQASTNPFTADTLASQIIRLDSVTGTYQRKLKASDSLYLSFFYVPGGWYGNQWELVGEAPSTNDSLFLEFYDLESDRWNVVWATGGHNADTAGTTTHWPWKFVNIKIVEERYFTKKFQFRFRNYASLDPNPKSGISGNCDHWNIDYVYLNLNRTKGDSLFRDVAFAEKAPSMLQKYQAMPARQYRSNDMATSLKLTIVNRYNQTLASNYSYKVYDEDGQQVAVYDGGFENIVSFYPNGRYQEMGIHSTPPVNFQFPESNTQTQYTIVHTVKEGVGGDIHNGNDTIVFNQIFNDYYAYDDGVPENGYGLTAPGNKAWLAYRFDLNTEDTLTAIDMYFNRTRNNENEDIQFKLCVWSCENGRPATLLHKEDAKLSPEFEGLNKFHRYKLASQVIVNGSIFIGFEQLSNDFINLGFDRNNDARSYTYYKYSNEWMQSILRGAVMIRPAFGQSALIDIISPQKELDVTIYPNPASTHLSLAINAESTEMLNLSIYDMRGREVWKSPFKSQIDLDSFANGIYLLRLTDIHSNRQILKKIIISK